MHVLSELVLRMGRDVVKRKRIAVKCDVYGNFDLSYCTSDLRTDFSLILLTVHLFTQSVFFTPNKVDSFLLFIPFFTNTWKLIAPSMIPIIVIIIITIQLKGIHWFSFHDFTTLPHILLVTLCFPWTCTGTLPFWPYLITGPSTGQFRDGRKRPSLIAH